MLAIVTSRLNPHVYILRSCSGSVGSCPFTFTPTNELGAKHDVITPIWLVVGLASGLLSPVPVSSDKATQTRAMTYTFVKHGPLRLLGDQAGT